MPGALDGIRVVDFGQYVAGPLAALWLAENGADVIRIDSPAGPRWSDQANAVLQRSKRSIVLDLAAEEDRDLAAQIVSAADVAIENFRPGVMDRLGLGWERLRERNPRLIYCSIPGFPEGDPRADVPAWEGIVSAAAGLYNPGRWSPPKVTFNPVPLASSFGAIIAAHAVVAALIARYRCGSGQRIEIPLFDAAMQLIGPFAGTANGDLPQAPNTNASWDRPYQCKDGRWVDVSPPFRAMPRFAERYLSKEVLDSGVADLYATNPENVEKLHEILAALYETKTAAEWEEESNREVGNGIVKVLTTAEWLRDPHALDTSCVVKVQDPELGDTAQAGHPVVLTKTPMGVRGPRHEVGADLAAVLAEAANADTSLPAGEGAEADLTLPLEGFKVVDTTQVLAGPTVARVLAEYGAEVVKINDPHPQGPGGAAAHTFVNSGKRSILLDLRQAEGRDILDRLVDEADVVLQNFVQGAAGRLGLGEEDIRERNPEIVYTSVSCHAYGGRRGGYRGHEQLQAVTGMELRLGGGRPQRANLAVCDLGTGHLGAFGVLLALFHRLRTGEGQHVQVALSRSATMLQVPFMIDHANRQWSEPSGPEATGWGPLNRLFQGKDRLFYVFATDLDRLHRVIGLEDSTIDDLEARFSTDTAATWVAKLLHVGVAAAVNPRDFRENMDDPVLQERRLSVVREHAGIGTVRSIGLWGRFSRTPPQVTFPVSAMGWDGPQIVEELGLEQEYDKLVEGGAVGVTAAG